ncbi:hypothetical protein [Deinococcus deserti]|uniref:Uncharacterized protein n=1 Tax=Deinococcus deserti (strain DSM 17065 / CIP 109153 / LMG 22923 / VCD115) TaxID=546414 RepID=C1CYI3_DEIDV|nr:hypothetical protein [Deinococcus deserti]ACO45004.1 hypothetical protein Deide_01960 [Deinococcus deserti VCD115]
MRYIITRPDLQEGSMRLLKYLEGTFPQSGPAHFVDDRGQEHAVQVDLERKRVWGLSGFFHAQHLGVNDVLHLTNLAPARYQVEAVVKPHAAPLPPRPPVSAAPETRRVVVSTSPHVREVRVQEIRAVNTAPVQPRQEAQVQEAPPRQDIQSRQEVPARGEAPARQEAQPRPTPEPVGGTRIGTGPTERDPGEARVQITERIQAAPTREIRSVEAASLNRSGSAASAAAAPAVARPLDVRFPEATARVVPAFVPVPDEIGAQLAELARLTGYRLHDAGAGVSRLSAELGAHGYSVLIAQSEAALESDAWQEEADYRVLLTDEAQRPANQGRLTREALVALIEHARLAPLSPVDLRGYWKAGSVDLESAASVAEFVSAHLAQRGAFSFVLLTLAQQPAHSVVSVQRLAERLGSGVNYAELGSILDTLTKPPFLALTPLPAGQYLLRVGVPELLGDLSEYAEGVRRRVRVPARPREREVVRA